MLAGMSDTDMELLARYTRQHAEDAFAELVQRHLGLVYSAALRQVRSPQLAEEVAQSVFIDLASSAARLKLDTILTAWLYQVTRRTVIDFVRRESSRQLREQIAIEMNAMNATAADWMHIEPLLDEAVHALDDTDRAAVLLRYFENKSLREVGATLGTSENAAQKRLGRAVERLREFFAKRGVTVGTSGLGVIISVNAVQAAPLELAATITSASLAGTSSGSGTAVTLLKFMAMTKLKLAMIGVIVAAIVVVPVAIKQISGEPSYGGKTVTQWLESLEFYIRVQRSDGDYATLRSPEAIAADPAVLALAHIGPRAMPVLIQRIIEPAELPQTMRQTERWNVLLRWKMFGKPGPRGYWPPIQERRKTAAGFALLALGTNAHGGFSRFMEAYAAAPQFTSVAGGRLSGTPVGVSSVTVVRAANAGLPELRAEIIAEVMAGLEHTNALYRGLALEAAIVFPRELLKRKNLLLRLTLDEGEYVQAAALGNLVTIVQSPALRDLISPAQIRQAAEAVLEAPNTSERNQGSARDVIRLADAQIRREANQ